MGWTRNLLGAAAAGGALFLACDKPPTPRARNDVEETPKSAREVGEDVGAATRKAGQTVKDAVEGFRDGVGGSGKEPIIGDRPGVINDGEGPLEESTTEDPKP
jgi:hypothetical protein